MTISDNMSWLLAVITILLHTMGSNISIFLAAITLSESRSAALMLCELAYCQAIITKKE